MIEKYKVTSGQAVKQKFYDRDVFDFINNEPSVDRLIARDNLRSCVLFFVMVISIVAIIILVYTLLIFINSLAMTPIKAFGSLVVVMAIAISLGYFIVEVVGDFRKVGVTLGKFAQENHEALKAYTKAFIIHKSNTKDVQITNFTAVTDTNNNPALVLSAAYTINGVKQDINIKLIVNTNAVTLKVSDFEIISHEPSGDDDTYHYAASPQ